MKKMKCVDKSGKMVSAPDFSVACIEFKSGVIARLTCGMYSPFDHSIQVMGDKGMLCIDECWNYYAPTYYIKHSSFGRFMIRYPLVRKHPFLKWLSGIRARKYPFTGRKNWILQNRTTYHDFCLGITELAAAIDEKRTCRLSPEFVLHTNEIVLAISNSFKTEAPYKGLASLVF